MNGKLLPANDIATGFVRVTLANTGPCTITVSRNGKPDVPLIVKEGIADIDVSSLVEVSPFRSASWSNFNGYAKVDLGAGTVMAIEADQWL